MQSPQFGNGCAAVVVVVVGVEKLKIIEISFIIVYSLTVLTSGGGGIVGAKLCFLLNILVRRLSSLGFFFRQHNKAPHILEQQFLVITIKLNKYFQMIY